MKVQPIRVPDPLGYVKVVMETLLAYIHGENTEHRIHPEQITDLQHVFYEYQYGTQDYLWDRSPEDRMRVLQCIKEAHEEIFGARINKYTLSMHTYELFDRIKRHEYLSSDARTKNTIRFLEDLVQRIEALQPLPAAERIA